MLHGTIFRVFNILVYCESCSTSVIGIDEPHTMITYLACGFFSVYHNCFMRAAVLVFKTYGEFPQPFLKKWSVCKVIAYRFITFKINWDTILLLFADTNFHDGM